MTSYTSTQRTELFQAANMVSPRLGIAEAEIDIEGAADTGGFVKTRIDSVAVGDGFISILALADRPTLPQPIPDDLVGVFIALVTRMARDLTTDRDYLLCRRLRGNQQPESAGRRGRCAPSAPSSTRRRSGRTRSPPGRRNGSRVCGRRSLSLEQPGAEVAARLSRRRRRNVSRMRSADRPSSPNSISIRSSWATRSIRSPEGRSRRQMQRRHQGSARRDCSPPNQLPGSTRSPARWTS